MRLKKTIQQSISRHKSLAVKLMSAQLLPVLTIGSQVLAVWLSGEVGLFPGTEVLMSILGTCSQIIAGLYGITLAGYTFFLSRIDALTSSDATLDYVAASIKNRFKYLIWYITGNVLMTLFTSIILMYCPVPQAEEMGFFYRLFCNEFVLFMGFSIVLILYYSVLVVEPNCISKEALRLKKKMEGRNTQPGDVARFIACYDSIQERCNSMLPEAVLRQLHENKGPHFELTLELMEAQRIFPVGVLLELTRIHRYYECVVNCSPMTVSERFCDQAERMLLFLEVKAVNPPPQKNNR